MVLAHERLLTSCSKFSMSQTASAHFPLISFIFTLMEERSVGDRWYTLVIARMWGWIGSSSSLDKTIV